MKISKGLLWAGIILILATGLIHLVETPHHFEEAKYVGILFLLNGIGAIFSAIGIYLQRNWGWILGAIVAGGAFVFYLISRTVGLPATHAEEWEALGIASLVIEGVFVLIALSAISDSGKS